MNNLRTKLQEVYFPFLIISIITVFSYNLFRWFFDIRLSIIPLKENLLNFWIPFAIPWIPVLIWLCKRIRILNIRGKNDNGYFLYQFAMVAAIAAPIIISQNYIEKSSFELNKVSSVTEIKELKNEKYFKIGSFEINQKQSLPYVTARTSGKNNQSLTYYLYLTCPFQNTSSVWYGVKYQKKLSNRLSEEQKESEYKKFLDQSEKDFANYNFYEDSYFEKLRYSDDHDGFLEALKNSAPNFKGKDQIILIPKKDVFKNRLGNSFSWIFKSFSIGAFILLIMILIPKINMEEYNHFKENKPLKEDDLKDFIQFLNPIGQHKATAILLLLNITVFLIMIFSGINIIAPTSKELLDIGGNRRFEVLNGAYWRLFTSIFIHGGIMHIVMNLFGLWFGTIFLENVLKPIKLILIYIICGLIASLASVFWHENIVSVGASGAIFGLYGLVLAFTVFNIYSKNTRGITWILLVLYAGVSLVLGFFGGIDNAAHIGGLIAGFIIGILLIVINKEKLKKNALQ